MDKKTIPPSVCLMPWLHLHIDTQGLVKACCNANIVYGNINKQSIAEIWKGERIRKFRTRLMSGEVDKRCGSCYKREEAGKSSVRTETLDKFPQHFKWVNDTDEEGRSKSSKPIYLDIRFSNVCNLKCRTCWHGASSSWFEEAKVLKNNVGDKAIIEATTDNLKLIQEIFEFNTEVDEIYFAGGEPLLMEEHYALLKVLIEWQNTSMHLRYNTNLSLLRYKNNDVCMLWSHFERVTLSVSVDGLEERGEYIRKGLNWNSLISNIEMIRKVNSHIDIEIAPTVSVFNISGIGNIHQYFVENGHIELEGIYLNMLHRPDYFKIKTLPIDLKNKATIELNRHIQWLTENKASYKLIKEFESIIEFMNNDDWSDQLGLFNKQIEVLDKMRNENFWEIFPELGEMRI